MEKYTKENLFEYIIDGKTQFHLTDKVKRDYVAAGYKELEVSKDFGELKNGKYFVMPYASCLIAFKIGKEAKSIRIAACHTDFPMLKLKYNPEMAKDGYLTLNTEPYGGLISSTWFDRPLGLAGKLVYKGENAFKPVTKLYDSERPLFLIPSLAPHLKADKDAKLDIAKELVPLAGLSGSKKIVEELLDVDVIDYDLYLYNTDKPVSYGLEEELIAAPRIDNISSAAAMTEAMISGEAADSVIAIAAYFDNEEIGSASKQGADSNMFREIYDRIIKAVSENADAEAGLRSNTFIASLDVAHAYHPNYPEKSDPTNKVWLGKGVILKLSASQRYVSDSEASAVITSLSDKYDVKIQKQVNKTGMPGGKTLGPIISSYIPAYAVDMGIPVLAMHSAVETAAVSDYTELCKLIEAIYKEV